jgi:hypothetical protein
MAPSGLVLSAGGKTPVIGNIGVPADEEPNGTFPFRPARHAPLPSPSGHSPSAPTVAIKATAAFQAEAEAAVAKSALIAADAHSAVASLLNGSLTVSCSDVRAVITYTGQPSATVNASLETGAAVSLAKSGTEWSATVALSHATATVPNEPELTALLTDVAAPLLLDYLNNHVLSAITVPAINLLGVQLAVPVITEEQSASGGDDFLIAYTGLNPVVAPTGGTAWPVGTLLAAVDAAALQAVRVALHGHAAAAGDRQPALA